MSPQYSPWTGALTEADEFAVAGYDTNSQVALLTAASPWSAPAGNTVNWNENGHQLTLLARETSAADQAPGVRASLTAAGAGSRSLFQIATFAPNQADITPPSAPSRLVATPGVGEVALSWDPSSDNVGVAGYKVYRNGVQAATTAQTSYTDTALTRGTSYAYRVAAYDAAGNVSPISDAATVVAPSPTWSADFAGTWGSGTSNTYSMTVGWWGFDGNPRGFIGAYGWSYTNQYFSFASDSVLPGSLYAFEARVDSNAAAYGEKGQRTALYQAPIDPNTRALSDNQSAAYEGQDQWYRWHVYFPVDFAPEPHTSWNWVDEFHQYPNSVCCANISFGVVTDGEDGGPIDPKGRLSVRVLGGGSPSKPIPDGTNMGNPSAAPSYGGAVSWFTGPSLELGHWYDVLLHVAWAWEPTIGQVQVYIDGDRIADYSGPTLYYYQHDGGSSSSPAGPGNDYLYSGYYRSGQRNGVLDTQADAVYHDGYMRGPTRGSVGG
jgi:hypothetical protein